MFLMPDVHKVGATFHLPFTVTGASGAAENISTWTIISQLRDVGEGLIEDFTISLIGGGTSGQAAVVATPAQTAAWPEGSHFFDIAFLTPGGEAYKTDTMQLRVERGPTIA